MDNDTKSGIYLHIPFCKQACHYCNFHFSTSLKYKSEMLQAIVTELTLRKDYLKTKRLDSIYFGGGTPSMLSVEDILFILKKIEGLYQFDETTEITFEANPDDLKRDYIVDLKNYTPINRFSVGVQSFHEADLKYMHRAHNAKESAQALSYLKNAGFHNITIDLIYGTPTMDDEAWQSNINQAITFDIPHLSCYSLTVEPQTPLEALIKKGTKANVDDEKSIRQFDQLVAAAGQAGYEHYEISNFAKENHRAVHNSNYWLGGHYLGIGPSAHSYNTIARQWNVANNAKYMKAIQSGTLPKEEEQIDVTTRYNEYMLTRLRTVWGVNEADITQFGTDFLKHFQMKSQSFLKDGRLLRENGIFTLSQEGKHYADAIAMDLFFE